MLFSLWLRFNLLQQSMKCDMKFRNYLNLKTLGFTEDDFPLLTSITSWYTCGSGKPRPGGAPAPPIDHQEHILTFFVILNTVYLSTYIYFDDRE